MRSYYRGWRDAGGELGRYADRLRALTDVVRSIHGHVELEDRIREIAERTREVMEASSVEVVLTDEESDGYRRIRSGGEPPDAGSGLFPTRRVLTAPLRDGRGREIGQMAEIASVGVQNARLWADLRTSEERYRTMADDVIDGSGVGMVVVGPGGRVVWTNQAFEEFFGLTARRGRRRPPPEHPSGCRHGGPHELRGGGRRRGDRAAATAADDPQETVARLGGDEFAIVLHEISDDADAVRLARRVRSMLEDPFDVDGRTIHVTASIGIALSSRGYDAPETMLRDADMAMYRAKEEGGDDHRVFDAGMHERLVEELDIETGLRHAIRRDELHLEYQPVYELASGAMVGVGSFSMRSLARLPADMLKIDRSFAAPGPARSPILEAVRTLAASLDLVVVAEGIEDYASLDLARDVWCTLGQGFLLARPMREEAVDRLLDEADGARDSRRGLELIS